MDNSILGKRKHHEEKESIYEPYQKKRKVEWKWVNDEEEELKETLRLTNDPEEKLKLQDKMRIFNHIGPQYFLIEEWNKKAKQTLNKSYQTHEKLFAYIKENFNLDKINLTQPFKVEEDEIIDLISTPSDYSWNQIIYIICTHDIYVIHNNEPKTLEYLFAEHINNTENNEEEMDYIRYISEASLMNSIIDYEKCEDTIIDYPDLIIGPKTCKYATFTLLRAFYKYIKILKHNTNKDICIQTFMSSEIITGLAVYHLNNTTFVMTCSLPNSTIKTWALAKTDNILYLLFIAKLQKTFAAKKRISLHPDIKTVLKDILPPHLQKRFASYLKQNDYCLIQ
jgi:hypothetical protein